MSIKDKIELLIDTNELLKNNLKSHWVYGDQIVLTCKTEESAEMLFYMFNEILNKK